MVFVQVFDFHLFSPSQKLLLLLIKLELHTSSTRSVSVSFIYYFDADNLKVSRVLRNKKKTKKRRDYIYYS